MHLVCVFATERKPPREAERRAEEEGAREELEQLRAKFDDMCVGFAELRSDNARLKELAEVTVRTQQAEAGASAEVERMKGSLVEERMNSVAALEQARLEAEDKADDVYSLEVQLAASEELKGQLREQKAALEAQLAEVTLELKMSQVHAAEQRAVVQVWFLFIASRHV